MRGCDKFCTFCVVPYVRGRERSLPGRRRAARGPRRGRRAARARSCFLGQTVNAYRDGDCDFAELLRRAADVPGIARIRFTSPHPADVTPRADPRHARRAGRRTAAASAGAVGLRCRARAHGARLHGRDVPRSGRARARRDPGDRALDRRHRRLSRRDRRPTSRRPIACSRSCVSIRRISTSTRRARSTRAATWPDSVPDDEKRPAAVAGDRAPGSDRRRAATAAGSAGGSRSWSKDPRAGPPDHVAGKTPQFTTAIVERDAAPGKPGRRAPSSRRPATR